ncbi:MAG TPA: HAMP domain-containing sensor histidine kinase, partial [Chitinophagales bacterium]|nr:HAMP domain-containing sensor histidine kinase [Chitinophagales bacterium]
TDILKSIPPGEEQEKILELTYKSSRELDQIVTDLSKIINLRGGQNPLELIDLKAEFDMAMQQNAVPEDHRKFIESDFSHAPTIRSVKAFIQSIFYNLLNNAFKYRSPDRELKVSIQSHESQGSIVITISDNGLGIDLTRHGGSVFKLFKRFHLNADGRGLGLYLVKEQVEALGGSIEIQSHPDKGTTFIIYHPV